MRSLNGSKGSIERMVKVMRGTPIDETTSRAARYDAARLGKAVRPVFLVIPFDGAVAANNTRHFPSETIGHPVIVESALTDQLKPLMNLARGSRRQEPFSTRSVHPLYFAGDMSNDANRIGSSEAFTFPEPIPLADDEKMWLSVTGRAADLNTQLDNTYYVMKASQVYADKFQEAQFNAAESQEIIEQIATTRQEIALSSAYFDFGINYGAREIELDPLDRWALLLGFATTLRHSTFDITDPRAHVWSKRPIPSRALAGIPFAQGGIPAFENYRLFTFPYLQQPNKGLTVTAVQRPAAGGYPNNINEAVTGELIALYKTI